MTAAEVSDRKTSHSENRDDEPSNWADTSDRLSRAFEDGGLTKWFEVAAREMEREADIERKRTSQASNRTVES
jgi:hypothetical protein